MKFGFRIPSIKKRIAARTSVRFMLQLLLFFSLGLGLIGFASCDLKRTDDAGGTYVGPSVTRTGKIRKGYVRRKVSLHKNAVRRQNRSRYYYHTRGKYHR
jgi:hypothetical protein